MAELFCIDCIRLSLDKGEKMPKRPASPPGPRCATHHRERKAAVKKANHDRHIVNTYGITPETYWKLYRLQGGKCYVCQISTGKAKNLAVDHDHRCCPGPKSCGKCIRGLACGHCNHDILPWVGDRPEDWERVMVALRDPIGRNLDEFLDN
jgi:recombination endonuclease VII